MTATQAVKVWCDVLRIPVGQDGNSELVNGTVTYSHNLYRIRCTDKSRGNPCYSSLDAFTVK